MKATAERRVPLSRDLISSSKQMEALIAILILIALSSAVAIVLAPKAISDDVMKEIGE